MNLVSSKTGNYNLFMIFREDDISAQLGIMSKSFGGATTSKWLNLLRHNLKFPQQEMRCFLS